MTQLDNDPRLTAYALGELEADDALEIEAQLAADPAACAAVEAIRAAAAQLSATLAAEPAPALDDFRRADLASAIRARSASAGLRIAGETGAIAGKTVSGASGSISTSHSATSVRAAFRPLNAWWSTAFAAAAAVVLAATGFLLYENVPGPRRALHDKSTGFADKTLPEVNETARKQNVDRLFAEADEFRKQQRYSEAAETMRRLLVVDASNSQAEHLLEVYEQGERLFVQGGIKHEYDRQFTRNLLDATEATVPWASDILYPSHVYVGDKSRLGLEKSEERIAGAELMARASFAGATAGDSVGGSRFSYGFQVPFNKLGRLGDSDRFALGDDRRGKIRSMGYAGADETHSYDLAYPGTGVYVYGAPFVTSHDGSATVVMKLRNLHASDVQSIVTELQKNGHDLSFGVPPTDFVANDADADAERAEFRSRIKQRQFIQEQHRQGKIDQLFATAEVLARQARFAEAAEAMRQVLYIDPSNQSATEWLSFFDQAQSNLQWRRVYEEQVAAEAYGPVHHNPYLAASSNPLSTFSIDVDTASYANVRRFLLGGRLPPAAAVRIEEFLNYFRYGYPIPGENASPPADAAMPPAGAEQAAAFSASMEMAACPWAPQHRLVRIGLRGWEPAEDQRPAASLVFLVDVSGSMNQPNKLPLVVQSLKLLVDRLRDDDRIAIAVYAGASGLALPSTPIRQRDSIVAALDNLSAGGSTNGGEGINLAYGLAAQNFIERGINRVILCTDGDFNVGVADRNALQTLIETKARSGVFLSVLGFGMDNLKDATLETLADRGNGNYAYIDSIDEARKVLVERMGGTLQTIAKDVKIQVEFNPAAVGAYRLLGYENRMLAARDFNDDTKDAGEIGAGHTVTALYEIVPVGVETPQIPSGAAPSASDARDSVRARSASARSDIDRTNAPFARNPFVVASEVAATLNDVVPPPPTAIVLEAETPELLAPDPAVDPLKYQTPEHLIAAQAGGALELLTLKLRYKEPEGDMSQKLEFALDDDARPFDDASADFRFAVAVAGFAMNLRGTPQIAAWPLEAIAETALSAIGPDAERERAEFLTLVKQAQALRNAE